jgi:hypothetical protein
MLTLKKWALSEENGVMTGVPDCVWVRGFVLNHLQVGSVRVTDLIRLGATEFGFTHQEIQAAGMHFAVTAEVVRGELYWRRPANLFAIWWGKRAAQHSECQDEQAAQQGG